MAATKKELQKQSNIYLLSAIGAIIVAALITPLIERGTPMVAVILAIQIGALALWIVGCIRYALSKGYPGWVGVLGILTICGLLILVLLPNKWTEPETIQSPTNYPRNPPG